MNLCIGKQVVSLAKCPSKRWLYSVNSSFHMPQSALTLRESTSRFDWRTCANNPIPLGKSRSLSNTTGKNKFDFLNITKEHVEDEEPVVNVAIRPKLRVNDILDTMEPRNFTIDQNSTILDAISHLVNEKMASALVVNSDSEIVGIFTARDVLKCIQQNSTTAEHRQRRTNFLTDIFIKDLMTSKQQLVYCSPSDSARRCREIMYQCKIRSLPVIDNGEVRGIITAKHLADASFSVKDTGGKKGFISNVTGRRGLPTGTKVNHEDLQRRFDEHRKHAAGHLDMDIASFALPHPFKRSEGVAMNRRLYGADELSTDISLCEDAHFALKITDPLATAEAAEDEVVGWGADVSDKDADSSGKSSSAVHIYLCVADGVGSWRQYGVDPRAYSHRLVENARKVIESDMLHRELIRHSPFDRDLDPVHPLDVIMDAWNMTNSEGVVGSTTICVATLDKKLGQLSYSNVGDGGLLVVRHIDTDVVGYMRQHRHDPGNSITAAPGMNGTVPGTAVVAGADSDLHIAYLSQQQLRSFNLPYQLGFSNLPEAPGNFETPSDADTASISVLPGDIIILATDGLFDNMDLDEIVKEVAAWERGDAADRVDALAEQLVQKARLLSLDKNRDSPFALLAKENDIMWGGGMPDDTSVVVARVTRTP